MHKLSQSGINEICTIRNVYIYKKESMAATQVIPNPSMELPPGNTNLFIDLTDYHRLPVRNALLKYGHLLKWPRASANIMHIGCGDLAITSNIVIPLIKCHIEKYHLTCVDKSLLLITRHIEDENMNEIDFEHMHIATNELSNEHKEKYDIMFSFLYMQLIPDYNQWIKNVLSMLKPGGQTFFLIGAQHPVSTVIQKKSIKGKWAKYLKDAAHLASTPFRLLQNPENWIVMVMRDYGFSSVKCKVLKESYVFKNIDTLQEFILCLEIIYKDIPKHMLKEFIDEFTASVAKRCYSIPGRAKYHMMYTTLLVVATK